MSDKPAIDAEVVPEQALAVRQPTGAGAVGILRPADSLDAIAEAFKQYQAVCERILTKDDYQLYEGKPRKKKSAWRKLATAFNVSTQIMDKEVLREGRNVIMAEVRVRAFTPGGRQAEAIASCDITEKCCASARSQKCHKSAWKGHYCCQAGCDGRKHWSHPDHDVISTAQTRATNRAIADLIGCGEVSAEELADDSGPANGPQSPKPTQPAPTPHPEPEKPATPAQAPSQAVPVPTVESRTKMIRWLKAGPGEQNRQTVTEYFRKLTDPTPLAPFEELEDLPLRFVSCTGKQFKDLADRIQQFEAGHPATHAFPPHPEPKPLAQAVTKAVNDAAAKSKDPLWWRNIIVPIPRKGMKKDEYLKHPDTLGSLYDLRHGNDEQAETARRRLWGFCQRDQAEGWTDSRGKFHEPSETDVKFYDAIRAFKVWFAANHPDEKL